MEAAWKSMEKKEKIPWIKKAAEDQKRYEVWTTPLILTPPTISPTLFILFIHSFDYCCSKCRRC